jgi:transposase
MVLLAAERRLRQRRRSPRSFAPARRRCAAGSSVIWPRESRDCARQPHPGAPRKVTEEYRKKLVHAVRHGPRSLGLAFSLWTLQRLADHMAEQTGIRVTYESVRAHLKSAGIVLSRPQHTITSPDPQYALKKKRSKRPETAASSRETISTRPTSST